MEGGDALERVVRRRPMRGARTVSRARSLVLGLVAFTLPALAACTMAFDRFTTDSSSDASSDGSYNDAGYAADVSNTGPDGSIGLDVVEAGEPPPDAGAAADCAGALDCLGEASACGAACAEASQQCQNQCPNQGCRNGCIKTEQSCRNGCASACVACVTQGCTASVDCSDAASGP
jgi:hypothetical protein